MSGPRVSRRSCLGLGLSLLAPGAEAQEHPLAPFDREVETFMAARKIPGGALAVVRDRRLIYARGYGAADPSHGARVRPDSLFRIASVSKAITGVAVLKLIESAQLGLEDRAFELLDLEPLAGEKLNPELRRITVRQLLHHTGGWDRKESGDPMFRPREIARQAGVPPPARPETVIRWMLSRPLDFKPGTRESYSNFGYCVLGRVIEKASDTSYERFVRERVLAPVGITRMRVGASRLEGRAPGEVRYWMADPETTECVFPPHARVSWPDGGFHLEAMDAHGGWIASAVDLARFAVALDDPTRSRILKPSSLSLLYEPPPAPVSRKPDGSLEDAWYACGWSVRPVAGTGRANYWHAGSLPGTSSLLVRRWDGLGWAVLFNQRSQDAALPDSQIDPALHRAAAAVREWPTQSLFPRYR